MADIVKMGRPQVRSSGKMATTDISHTGQTPSLSSSVNQNSKHSASTTLPTAFDQGFPALPDPIPQNVNFSHASAESNQMHQNDWFPQDEPPSRSQSKGIETSGGTSVSVHHLTHRRLLLMLLTRKKILTQKRTAQLNQQYLLRGTWKSLRRRINSMMDYYRTQLRTRLKCFQMLIMKVCICQMNIHPFPVMEFRSSLFLSALAHNTFILT